MVELLLAALLAAAPPAFEAFEPPAPATPSAEPGFTIRSGPAPSSTQRYVARCEAQKGVALMTVNKRDQLVLACVKWSLERVPLAEEDP